MRIMAVDYGDVRTGLAVSDPTRTLVGDAWVVTERSMKALAGIVAGEASARGVSIVVVGYPKNMDGTIGPRAEKSDRLAALLRDEHGLETVLWDERRTSADAHRILFDAGNNGRQQKKRVDAVAAALILEGYLATF